MNSKEWEDYANNEFIDEEEQRLSSKNTFHIRGGGKKQYKKHDRKTILPLHTKSRYPRRNKGIIFPKCNRGYEICVLLLVIIILIIIGYMLYFSERICALYSIESSKYSTKDDNKNAIKKKHNSRDHQRNVHEFHVVSEDPAVSNLFSTDSLSGYGLDHSSVDTIYYQASNDYYEKHNNKNNNEDEFKASDGKDDEFIEENKPPAGMFSFPLIINATEFKTDHFGIQIFKKGPIPNFSTLRCITYNFACIYLNKLTIIANRDNDFVCSVKKNIIYIILKNTIFKRMMKMKHNSDMVSDTNKLKTCQSTKEDSEINCDGIHKFNIDKCYLLCTFKWVERYNQANSNEIEKESRRNQNQKKPNPNMKNSENMNKK